MRIDPTDPVPLLLPEPHRPERTPDPHSAKPEKKAQESKPQPTNTTNVVVDIENHDTMIYKFVDASSGKVIQQIPSQQMVNFAEAIAEALRKQESRK